MWRLALGPIAVAVPSPESRRRRHPASPASPQRSKTEAGRGHGYGSACSPSPLRISVWLGCIRFPTATAGLPATDPSRAMADQRWAVVGEQRLRPPACVPGFFANAVVGGPPSARWGDGSLARHNEQGGHWPGGLSYRAAIGSHRISPVAFSAHSALGSNRPIGGSLSEIDMIAGNLSVIDKILRKSRTECLILSIGLDILINA
jgi:hypothetical protein